MPQFFIRTTNCRFIARDDGAEYEQAADALAYGLKAALQIASDEMQKGGDGCAVEVSVEGFDGVPVLRSALSVSVSPLKPDTRVFTSL
jgi:hypothetical protein